ncbi:MAG TPA: DUF1385 domain-containing protein [Gaiellaceae bacterium]|nr:DUF1385 domain-containing protein [Gaiellaceae bacterium]
MADEKKVRLGGMALANGVLVHGPTSWACAIRTADGRLEVASRRKRFAAADVRSPLLRGPLRLAEVFALVPEVKRALPEAQLPFARGRVVGAVLGSAAVVHGIRRSRLRATAKELLGSLLSVAPAVLSLREGSVAAYHGAEHIAIGSYEHGSPREREHERCGTHLVGPLLATATAGNVLAARAPAHLRPAARLAATVGAVAASTEVFGWMLRHPDHRLARALAKPGHEFQHRVATAEPTREQLEVAEAALRACLELETA